MKGAGFIGFGEGSASETVGVLDGKDVGGNLGVLAVGFVFFGFFALSFVGCHEK